MGEHRPMRRLARWLGTEIVTWLIVGGVLVLALALFALAALSFVVTFFALIFALALWLVLPLVIAFLLFIVGLEIDIRKLKHVGLVASLGGIIQIAFTFAIAFAA